MRGWIKLNREIINNCLWNDKPFTKGQAWIDLLLSANHKPAKIMIKNNIIAIERGQQARSEVTLSANWGWSRTKVRRFLKLLESEGMVIQQKSNVTSIITICNYSKYQDGETSSDTPSDTAGEQQEDSRKTAGEHQTIHKQECNNDLNVKNGNKSSKDLSPKADDPVIEIFEFWKQIMNKNNSSILNAKRSKAIKARLKEGYTVDQIKQAILGCAATPHNMGQNDNGKRYDDIELICRDGTNVERFANNSTPQPVQKFGAAAERTINNIMNVELK